MPWTLNLHKNAHFGIFFGGEVTGIELRASALLRQDLTNCPGWAQACNLPASVSLRAGLQVYTPRPGFAAWINPAASLDCHSKELQVTSVSLMCWSDPWWGRAHSFFPLTIHSDPWFRYHSLSYS